MSLFVHNPRENQDKENYHTLSDAMNSIVPIYRSVIWLLLVVTLSSLIRANIIEMQENLKKNNFF